MGSALIPMLGLGPIPMCLLVHLRCHLAQGTHSRHPQLVLHDCDEPRPVKVYVQLRLGRVNLGHT